MLSEPSTLDVERLVMEVRRLRRALRFYADPCTYRGPPPTVPVMPIAQDRGRGARRALDGPRVKMSVAEEAPPFEEDEDTPTDA